LRDIWADQGPHVLPKSKPTHCVFKKAGIDESAAVVLFATMS